MFRTAALVAALVLASLPAKAGAAVGEHDTSLPWFGVRLGGLAAAGSLAGGTPTAAGAGGYALFDGREFLADVGLDLYFGNDARFIAAGIGAYYAFLPRSNTTPYAGGGLKLGWTRFGADGAWGLIPFFGGGVLIGRTYYPQIRVELIWFVNTSSEERGAERSHSHGPMLTLGLGF
jgi:hypothetical protein